MTVPNKVHDVRIVGVRLPRWWTWYALAVVAFWLWGAGLTPRQLWLATRDLPDAAAGHAARVAADGARPRAAGYLHFFGRG